MACFRLTLTFCLLLGGLLTASGCNRGPKMVEVSGVVYMDGEPLKHEGFVRIEPAEGRAAIGKIDPADGSFTMTSLSDDDGCLIGVHPVSVMVSVNVGFDNFLLIDEKYSNSTRSGLTVNLTSDTDDLKIELTGGFKKIPRGSGETIDEGVPQTSDYGQ